MNIPQELRDNPGRVADRHVAFRFEWQLQGGHVHIKVRAASRHLSAQVNHSRGLCGELTMTPDEWKKYMERAGKDAGRREKNFVRGVAIRGGPDRPIPVGDG